MKLVKRGAFALLLLSFISTARCYHTDFAAAVGGVPIVGAIVVPPEPQPAYIEAIGTPAPLEALEDPGVESWWPEDPEEATSTLRNARHWLVAARTPAGWTELCSAASGAMGQERDPERPQLAALGCSSDPAITRLQTFAVLVLRLDPEAQLFLAGAAGSSRADFDATLAQIRVECTSGYASRHTAQPSVALACTLPDVNTGGDAAILLEQAIQAYLGLAEAIVTLDPEVSDEPAFDIPADDS